MNKFDFIVEQPKFVEEVQEVGFCKEYRRNFSFSFVAEVIGAKVGNIVSDFSRVSSDEEEMSPRTSSYGTVIKSEICQNVFNQLKLMFKQIKSDDEQMLYLKMSKATKDKFRIYYSYEVSYPPREVSDEDRQVGKIVGSIMGVKIIQSEDVKQDEVIPMVRTQTIKSKIARVL